MDHPASSAAALLACRCPLVPLSFRAKPLTPTCPTPCLVRGTSSPPLNPFQFLCQRQAAYTVRSGRSFALSPVQSPLRRAPCRGITVCSACRTEARYVNIEMHQLAIPRPDIAGRLSCYYHGQVVSPPPSFLGHLGLLGDEADEPYHP